jgi:DNA-directed RNA polymerase subunit H
MDEQPCPSARGRLDPKPGVPEVASQHLVKKQSKEKEPSYDVFKHELVPKHVLLKPSETKDVLERYHIKPFQIPYIKSTDPAVRAIGAKPGDIVKVVRRSATAGESDFYRYVVEDF